MKYKESITGKVVALFLTVALILSGITGYPFTVHAAGWLDYAGSSTLIN